MSADVIDKNAADASSTTRTEEDVFLVLCGVIDALNGARSQLVSAGFVDVARDWDGPLRRVRFERDWISGKIREKAGELPLTAA